MLSNYFGVTVILELHALAGIKLKISSGKEKKERINKFFLYNTYEIK